MSRFRLISLWRWSVLWSMTLLIACQASDLAPDLGSEQLPIQGRCGVLPAIHLSTVQHPVSCVGLIDDDLSFPRGVAALQTGDDWQLYLVDKGVDLFARDANGQGSIFRYRGNPKTGFQRQQLFSGLDHPSGISLGQGRAPDWAYVATPTQILRFDLNDPDQLEVVIDGLPTPGWHYQTAVLAAPDALYVTVPSASDHCEPSLGQLPPYPCPEVAEATPTDQLSAVIRRYALNDRGVVASEFTIVGRGLRDPLAMVRSGNLLLAADNGWDQIPLLGTNYAAEHDPQDEINVVRDDQHYGWPYCFAAGQLTPLYQGYGIDCDQFQGPLIALAAHSAPLGMTLSANHLIVNLHGFAASGGRTVAFPLGSTGLPQIPGQTWVDWDYQHRSPGPRGRPFGIAALGDQGLVVTDDWYHSVMWVQIIRD